MNIRNDIVNYSNYIGNNSLIVQGPGGNISWKDKDIIWIKASGTWLADALKREIFLPLNLTKLRQLIQTDITDYSSAYLFETKLRPSIETSLHALLPFKFVVHVHAINVLTQAIQYNAKKIFSNALSGLDWTWVDYVKPGTELTKVIMKVVNSHSPPNIIVLGNHGIIIAGETISQVNSMLNIVLTRCEQPVLHQSSSILQVNLDQIANQWRLTDYHIPSEAHFHSLALNKTFQKFIIQKWVMYPDHAIFLNGAATIKNNKNATDFLQDLRKYSPPLIIDFDQGVVVHKKINKGQIAMIQCYLDVLSRLDDINNIRALNDTEIEELLNWDAERYRQNVNSTTY